MPTSSRNRTFDVLRIVFATAVILAHAPELIDGDRHRELVGRFTGGRLTLGTLAVDGFFLLSGYLITQSWLRNPSCSDFLKRRITRIVPGYATAYVLSTVLVGLLAPSEPEFFRTLIGYWPWYKNLLLLSPPATPPVLAGAYYHLLTEVFGRLLTNSAVTFS